METWIQSARHARALLFASGKVGLPARVHTELETGTHRTGLEGDELDEVVVNRVSLARGDFKPA